MRRKERRGPGMVTTAEDAAGVSSEDRAALDMPERDWGAWLQTLLGRQKQANRETVRRNAVRQKGDLILEVLPPSLGENFDSEDCQPQASKLAFFPAWPSSGRPGLTRTLNSFR